MPENDQLIYKLLTESQWQSFQNDKVFNGSEVDIQDGFIHFSTQSQVAETAAKHFGHLNQVWLLEVDTKLLDAELKWEVSRGGDLFPHLYGSLPMTSVVGRQLLNMSSLESKKTQEDDT